MYVSKGIVAVAVGVAGLTVVGGTALALLVASHMGADGSRAPSAVTAPSATDELPGPSTTASASTEASATPTPTEPSATPRAPRPTPSAALPYVPTAFLPAAFAPAPFLLASPAAARASLWVFPAPVSGAPGPVVPAAPQQSAAPAPQPAPTSASTTPSTGQGTVLASPGTLDLSASTSATPRGVITLTAAGRTPVAWTAASSAPWLTLDATSGQLAGGTASSLTVSVDRAGEPDGRWTAVVTLQPGTDTVTVTGRSLVQPAVVLSVRCTLGPDVDGSSTASYQLTGSIKPADVVAAGALTVSGPGATGAVDAAGQVTGTGERTDTTGSATFQAPWTIAFTTTQGVDVVRQVAVTGCPSTP